MHTHFYVHRSHGTKAMNKLQKEVSEYLVSLDGKLISTSDLKEFQKIVILKIQSLNKMHSRCKPIEASFDNKTTSNYIRLSGYYIENIYLYKATLTHISTLITN